MAEVIKFTDDELSEIKFIQNKFQDKLIKFGQIHLETIELDERLLLLKNEQARLKTEYISLQKSEQELMDKLTKKYGDGSLNIKDGTFTPS
jgi:predicted transcriptional regulator